MAVFGVPLLHEDDVLRAVRAASEMREALLELNAELARDYGTELELRIGVNTGEVVTGTVERLATGDGVTWLHGSGRRLREAGARAAGGPQRVAAGSNLSFSSRRSSGMRVG